MKKVMGTHIAVVVVCTLFGADCKDMGTAPEPLKPGRRDYVWTVDTLRIQEGDNFYPTGIWGSSPNDVWVSGTGSPPRLWHFDGASWSHDSIVLAINPFGLWGFASNDIWLGNSFGAIWRYDGVHWHQHTTLSVPGFDGVGIPGVWGSRADDVWGVGSAFLSGGAYKGAIVHFDGSQWRLASIADIRVQFGVIRGQRATGCLFVDGYRFEPTGDTCKIFAYDGRDSLRQIYSDPYSMTVQEVAGEVYFVSRSKIYKYINGSLTLWRDFSAYNYGWMVGRSEMDFFGTGGNEDIVHYNGTDLVTLFPNTLSVWNMFLVGDSVFVICVDLDHNWQPYVIHGKLK